MNKLTEKQQLRLIEGLCLLFEDGDRTFLSAKGLLADIYEIAHLNGTCKNEHLDWHKKGFELAKTFKDYLIIDIDK
jgi:hypothetical protein